MSRLPGRFFPRFADSGRRAAPAAQATDQIPAFARSKAARRSRSPQALTRTDRRPANRIYALGPEVEAGTRGSGGAKRLPRRRPVGSGRITPRDPKEGKTTADAVIPGSLSIALAAPPAGNAAGATARQQGQISAGKWPLISRSMPISTRVGGPSPRLGRHGLAPLTFGLSGRAR
jgi:hypothetical protein